MTALFVFALPFAVFGAAYGSYCLGCLLERQLFCLWVRLRQKEKGR